MRVPDSESQVGAPGSGQELAPGSGHELAGADQLISDLGALLDAGLLVVHESVLGPARYGVAPVSDRHDGGGKTRTSQLRRHHAQLT